MPSKATSPKRILYGLPSEGMGHAIRSRVLVQWLQQQGHFVTVATSGRAAPYMAAVAPVIEIEGLHLLYEENRVNKTKSVGLNLRPQHVITNLRQLHRSGWIAQPDICISDFDSFVFAFAKLHRLPLLCVDNIHYTTRCRVEFDVPQEWKKAADLACALIRLKAPGADGYIVVSCWPGRPILPRTVKVPPLLRDAILTAKPCRGTHVLVYQTSTSQTNLVSALRLLSTAYEFRVYGLNRDENFGSVRLRCFSEAGFLEDLATCAAVVTNGGHTLICEALYLHKPLCCFPIKGQYEQYLNARYVQELGYGECVDTFSGAAVVSFLDRLDVYQNKVNAYHQAGNDEAFQAVNHFIHHHCL